MSDITLSELAAKLGGQLDGDAPGERVITGVASLDDAGENQVSFLANVRYEKRMGDTSAGAVIVATDYAGPRNDTTALIRCDDAYYAYRQAMIHFYGFRQHDFEGVDQRAAVDPGATLGKNVRIGAFATVSAGVKIGDDTTIYPGVFIGPDCSIGSDCTIYPNVTLYDGTIAHDRVTIHAGSSIGHDGFGYATHAGDDGVVRHEKIPQAGWVELEDDVEIGACCTIDRATMGSTVIGAGTKFSNLIAVGHGTKMGKHCLIVAQVGVAGSVEVGNYCVFAGQVGMVGHIRIGDGVKIGAQAGVSNDVAAGLEVLGTPAIPLPEARRALIAITKLPEMRKEFHRMRKKFRQVCQQLGIGEKKDSSTDEGK